MANEASAPSALSLGGNLGDVAAAFVYALLRLRDAPGVEALRVSSVYRTPPWGKLDQPDFLNMAALIETTLPARELLALCLDIERGMGRRRLERWGPRTLDIDILTYGESIIDEPDLTIPHPRIAERAFVLAPLAEIAPRLTIGGQEVGALLALADRAGVALDPGATASVRKAIEFGGVAPRA